MSVTLAPEEVEPLLRGRFGRPYRYAAACASTQRLLDESLPEGAVAVCELQTSGRGRFDRRWEAPAGTAILCSVLLRPPPRPPAPELALVAGIAVAQAVERATRRSATIKWPNDVLLDGRKVAGVLAEARGAAVVLGIGLNVNQEAGDLPARAVVSAGSLLTVDGRLRPRAPLLADLLELLEARYDGWRSGGLAPLGEELARRDALRGRHVRVGDVAGVAAGIGVDGRLQLETGAGRVAVASGEATVATGRLGS